MLLYSHTGKSYPEMAILLVIIFPILVIASLMGWLKEGDVPTPEEIEKDKSKKTI